MLIFTFKVMVTTLILVLIAMLALATWNAKNTTGKKMSAFIIILYILSILAIWG